MKRFTIALFSLIFLLIAAVIIVPSFIDWNKYKSNIIEIAEKQTGYNIDLMGDLKISLLPSPEAYISGVTVKSPKSQKYDNLVKLERLDLSLAFGPLLSGQLEVTSLELVKPEIFIEVFEDSSQSWQTDEINNLMSRDDVNQESDSSNDSGLNNISLQNVIISQGKMSYFDTNAKSESLIDDVTVTLKADTFSGPFFGNGSVKIFNRNINFEGKTGRLDNVEKSIALNVNGSIEPENVYFSFGGVVGFAKEIDVQGETEISIDNLNDVVSGTPLKDTAFNTKGILTFADGKFDFKNANLALNDQKLKANLSGSLEPFKMNVDVSSSSFNTAQIFSGSNIPQTRDFRFKGMVVNENEKYALNDFVLNLDEMNTKGDVSYLQSKRPKLTLDVDVNALDANMFTTQQISNQNVDLEDTFSSMKFPFDMNLKLNIGTVLYQNLKLNDVRTSVSTLNNSVSIKEFVVNSVANSKISLTADIENIQTIEGLNADFSIDSSNFKKTLSAFEIDTSNIPQGLNKGGVSLQAKGNKSLLDITAAIKAAGGEIVLGGNLKNILGKTPSLSETVIQIKHKNFNDAVNLVAPGFGVYSNLNKPVNIYTKVEQNGAVYQLNDIKADLGGIAAQGSASIDISGSKPNLSGDLKLGDVVIKGGKDSANQSATSSWSRQALESSWLNMIDFDFKLAAKSIDYQGWNMMAPRLDMTLNNGTLKLTQLSGGLYDGQVFLSGDTKAFGQDGGYTINGDVKLRDVSFEPLVKSFAGNQILKGSGLVDLDSNVSMAGISPAALISTLKGEGILSGEKIVLDGFNLKRFARALSSDTKPGDTALGLFKTTTKGGQTNFDTMDGQFNIREGIININKLDMDGPEALLSTTGNINLPQFQLSTTHEVSLKEEDVPAFKINISGPLNNPAQTLGQGLINDYISRKVNRKLEDLISDKLGDKLGFPSRKQPQIDSSQKIDQEGNATSQGEQTPANDDEPQEIDPEDAIKGLLRGILQ